QLELLEFSGNNLVDGTAGFVSDGEQVFELQIEAVHGFGDVVKAQAEHAVVRTDKPVAFVLENQRVVGIFVIAHQDEVDGASWEGPVTLLQCISGFDDVISGDIMGYINHGYITDFLVNQSLDHPRVVVAGAEISDKCDEMHET